MYKVEIRVLHSLGVRVIVFISYRNVFEEVERQHYCVFTEWATTLAIDNPCKHCSRLEKGISIDMYRKYNSLEFVPDEEKTNMWNFLGLRYPLYFRIVNWLKQTM